MAGLQFLLATSLITGLATTVQAFTQPTVNTWGPLLTPNLVSSVTQGQSAAVTWDPQTHPTDGVTVSLVLCHGNSANCVLSNTAIVEGLPAAQKSYTWEVPCSLATGTQSTDTGYGMLIIVDGTGEFQYSQQFSVLANPACSASSSTTASSTSTASTTPSSITTTTTGSSSSIPWTSVYTSTTTSSNSTHPITYSSSSHTQWNSSSSWSTQYTNTTKPSTILTTTYATGSTTQTGAVQSSSHTTTAATTTSTVKPFTGTAGRVGSSAVGLLISAAVAMLAL